MFDPHAIRHFSGTYAEARRKFLDAAAGQGASIEFALASMSEDHSEGVAAFLERRKPRFKGR